MAHTRIKSLQALHLKIRLKKPVRHASHSRTHNDTLVVRCELTDGCVGWGESLPRPYVTGETIDSAMQQLQDSDPKPLANCDWTCPTAVVNSVSQWHVAEECSHSADVTKSGYGNSVRCAVELALLDASSRAAGVSVSRVIQDLAQPLGLHRAAESVRYSGVITASTGRVAEFRSALKMKLFGFDAVKLKVGLPENGDRRLAASARRILGHNVDLRIDANEAWRPEEAAQKIGDLQPFGISCVEQPISDAHRSSLAGLKRSVNVPIMLDESLCSVADAEQAVQQQSCDAFNIRISKCGGIHRSLQIMKIAHDNGLFHQLGCLVGETGILSAAGRHLACNTIPAKFYEGSYDRFLVRDRLTDQDMTFGYGGRASTVDGPGLGIDVNESEVKKATQACHRWL